MEKKRWSGANERISSEERWPYDDSKTWCLPVYNQIAAWEVSITKLTFVSQMFW